MGDGTNHDTDYSWELSFDEFEWPPLDHQAFEQPPQRVSEVATPRRKPETEARLRRRSRQRLSLGRKDILHFFEDVSLKPSQALLGLCEIFDIRQRRDFLFAFFELILGVRPTRKSAVGKTKGAMINVLDSNAASIHAAMQKDSARLDTLRLLRRFHLAEHSSETLGAANQPASIEARSEVQLRPVRLRSS
jgi:hypothetical protein